MPGKLYFKMHRGRKPKINRLEKHHIIPRSRGGNSYGDNVIYITAREHRAYHILFGNMRPEEIIPYLKKYYFNQKV